MLDQKVAPAHTDQIRTPCQIASELVFAANRLGPT